MDLSVVLTSVVCSALVSGGFILLNAHLDRAARRKELLFRTSFELAQERSKMTWDVAKTSNSHVLLKDPVYQAEHYYKWVKHLYETGELPEIAKIFLAEESKKYEL